jgi:hypothetical protein
MVAALNDQSIGKKLPKHMPRSQARPYSALFLNFFLKSSLDMIPWKA